MSRAMAAIAVIVVLYLLGYSGTGVGAFAPVHTLGLSPYETATIGSATFNDWWVERVNAALLSPRSFAWRATEGKGRINDGVRSG